MKFGNFDVNEGNLLPFLSPTSAGTNWFDPPPSGVVSERGVGRILLQFHQLAEMTNRVRDQFGAIRFLDIGTGNGLLPNLVSEKLGASVSIGLDPYEDGEHQTSWAKNTRAGLFSKALDRMQGGYLNFEDYDELIGHEEFFKPPAPIKFAEKQGDWIFVKEFLENYQPQSPFNLFFAKCIDHIHDWNSLFLSAANIAEKGALLVIKHNSFFGFNGAHRYASTFVPWGHVVMSEAEYTAYVHEFHAERAEKMLQFYFEGLTFERKPIASLLQILENTGWGVKSIEKSVGKDMELKLNLVGGLNELGAKARLNFPDVGVDELLSGRMFIVAERR